MGCGSCGGGRSRVYPTVSVAGGPEPVRTRYVWRWVSSDGLSSKVFDSQGEAADWMKSGNPGALTLEPAV